MKDVLQTRFPHSNFDQYLAFVYAHTAHTGMLHGHHVAPRAEFPEHVADPQNIVNLSVPDHIRAHELLAEAVPECGSFQSAVAYLYQLYPSDVTSNPEEMQEAFQRAREAMREAMKDFYQSEDGQALKIKQSIRMTDMLVKRHAAGEQGIPANGHAFWNKRPSKPVKPTEFERQCQHLGTTELKAMKHCDALKMWASAHRYTHYIPEELLAFWGLKVHTDDEKLFTLKELD